MFEHCAGLDLLLALVTFELPALASSGTLAQAGQHSG
jgi:hypothetical protein